MSNKLIYIILDGLRHDVCSTHMGYLHHLVEQGQMRKYTVYGQLPSCSRPLYELLLTGVLPCDSGISSNACTKLSRFESLFHLCKQQGKTTAAAAYHWMSELYNQTPFSPFTDRIQFNPDKPIQNGVFYWDDNYPDAHLLADANALITHSYPDFVLVHSMGIDNAGHKHGALSPAYNRQAMIVDETLAMLLPVWTALGYQVVITSDHGMDEQGLHGGTRDEERTLPLFILAPHKLEWQEDMIPQTQVAPLCCMLLGLDPSKHMQPLTAMNITPQTIAVAEVSNEKTK